MAYDAPESIVHGKDWEVLNTLIRMHSPVPNPRILDSTHNRGSMWKGCAYYPCVRADISSEHRVDVLADFCHMPFADGSFDCIVFDPPHLPTNAATTNSSRIWESRYGITSEDTMRAGDNVSPMFQPFLAEAKRVLVHGGIVLAKIADLTHNHRYQWQHVDFINDVRSSGMTPCDCIIKADPNAGNLKSSLWKNVKHVRKAHCYWIVVRNSSACENRAA